MNVTEWERFLLHITEQVMVKVSPLAERGGRGRTVGIGASGDKTIVADKVAEDILLKALAKVGVRILSEEAGEVGSPGAPALAIVDPLDGSSNFERGIPFYCTSVAIAEGESIDNIVVGVVRDLVSGDTFVARKGKGATKNGRQIRTSRTTNPSDAVVGVDLSRSPPSFVQGLAPLVGKVKRQVHFGANALELCYLAEGKFDAFVDLRGKIRITDFAASALIAREAGAMVTDAEGRSLKPAFNLGASFSFVASANPVIHRKILALCNPASNVASGRHEGRRSPTDEGHEA